MKTPPFLMAAALLLWGWQAGFLVWALVIAVIVESSRFISTRWEFTGTDLNRVFDLCSLLFLGAVAILYASDETLHRPFQFAQWQPFIFLPLILAQAFGTQEKIPFHALSLVLRRSKNHPLNRKGINISYLYFAVCLLGASAGNIHSKWFYFGMATIICWALFAVKPPRFRNPVWLALLVVAMGVGYSGQLGLNRAQSLVETILGNWIMKLLQRPPDYREGRTSIGRVGDVQLSGRVVWRVEPREGHPAPLLLRELSYDSYFGNHEGVWRISKSDFVAAGLETNDSIILLPPKEKYYEARIAGALPRKRGLLPLPPGSFELRDIPVALETNGLAIAKVEEGPGFVNFTALHGSGLTLDGPTNANDLAVPEMEQKALNQIAQELGLASKNDDEKLTAIRNFFYNNFNYSTRIGWEHIDRTRKRTPLTMFLTETRSGHCEYFATATVLLLRQAGIPARYGVGYSVQESARKRNTYIVRERHGHAWALVYHNGAWEDFDTTPPSWDDAVSARASWWEPISDFFSVIGHQFSKWRWSKTAYTKYLVWLLIPLMLFLAYRIFSRKRRKQGKAGPAEKDVIRVWPGKDSEFYQLERTAAQLGIIRTEGEPLTSWRKRLDESPVLSLEKLDDVLQLHHRYRFDPQGLTTEERQRLKDEVEAMLRALKQRSSAN